MAKAGPIILIEDDIDDQNILGEALREIGVTNEVISFLNAPEAFTYLKTTTEQPFIILCDVNLPKQNGIDFKRQIDSDPQLRKKSIPFLFFSTSVDQNSVNEAYTEMTVQGFFQKSNTYKDLKKMVKLIIDYWMACRHPNVKANE